MAIVDWITERSNPNINVNLEIDNPIYGTGSLRISQEDLIDTGTDGVAIAHMRVVAGPPHSQFLKGKVRSIIKPLACTDSADTVSFFGLCAMMNKERIFEKGGKCYVAGRWGNATPSWRICRVNNGITSAGSFTHLAHNSLTNLPGIGDAVAIEFEWVYDPLEFSGVRLTLSASPDENFRNMTVIYQIVDTAPQYLRTSLGEGLFFSTLYPPPPANEGPPFPPLSNLTVLYDRTTHFELVRVP